MVAILVTGRVGSAITAELASMKVYQEIDALVTMNIPPERMLVMPRLVAVLFMMPVLATIANLCGWFGARWCANTPLHLRRARRLLCRAQALHGDEGSLGWSDQSGGLWVHGDPGLL